MEYIKALKCCKSFANVTSSNSTLQVIFDQCKVYDWISNICNIARTPGSNSWEPHISLYGHSYSAIEITHQYVYVKCILKSASHGTVSQKVLCLWFISFKNICCPEINQSNHDGAHATTAKLSWRVPIVDLIRWSKWKKKIKKDFLQDFNYELLNYLWAKSSYHIPVGSHYIYRQVSDIRRTLVGNKIVDHSDVVGASPVGAAPTTSSFSTWTPGFIGLGKDNCKARRETLKFRD